jgi:hypothetical protein
MIFNHEVEEIGSLFLKAWIYILTIIGLKYISYYPRNTSESLFLREELCRFSFCYELCLKALYTVRKLISRNRYFAMSESILWKALFIKGIETEPSTRVALDKRKYFS